MAYLSYGLLVLLAVVGFFWGRSKLQAVRGRARARESAVLTALHEGVEGVPTEGFGQFDPNARLPPRGGRGIEVAEDPPIDIEALLAAAPTTAAARARAQLDEPTNIDSSFSSSWPSTGHHTLSPQTRGLTANSGLDAGTRQMQELDLDVPLRNLVLAWHEARGYRLAPASTDLRPLEVVLRHRDDPDRNYAYLYDPGRATAPRASALLDQARRAGLGKLLIAAEHGGDSALRGNRVRGVRMVDWPTIQAELKRLDRQVAEQIVAVARERSAGGIGSKR